MKSQQGFTLLELLIVLVILALVAGLVIQTATSGTQLNQAKQVAERFITVYEFAKQESLLSERLYGIKLAEQSYWFKEFDSQKRQWLDVPNDKILGEMQLPDNISMNLTDRLTADSSDASENLRTGVDLLLSPSRQEHFTLVISVNGNPVYRIHTNQGKLELVPVEAS